MQTTFLTNYIEIILCEKDYLTHSWSWFILIWQHIHFPAVTNTHTWYLSKTFDKRIPHIKCAITLGPSEPKHNTHLHPHRNIYLLYPLFFTGKRLSSHGSICRAWFGSLATGVRRELSNYGQINASKSPGQNN